jgi:membrane carboxypeptidase/penicillin-binding protein
MNTAAQKIVATRIDAMEKRLKLPQEARLEGALAAVDPSSGYIRALVGGRSYARSNFNRILNMRRQVGSTFKPIVYLTAFRKGARDDGTPYGPATPAEDAPWKLVYDHGRQTWAPRDYEREFMGWVSYRAALAHSLNVVAAKIGMAHRAAARLRHDRQPRRARSPHRDPRRHP